MRVPFRNVWQLSLILLFVRALCLVAVAGPAVRTVTIQTEPAGAAVYDQYGAFLGTSGSPIALDTAKYASLLQLDLKKDGYDNANLQVQLFQLEEGGVWPTTPLRLHRTWSRTWLWLFPGVGLALLMLARWLRRRPAPLVLEPLAVDTDPSASLSSTVLGGYRLLDRIGVGGMATVYRAVPVQGRSCSEPVAVKVVRRELCGSPEMLERFRRETRVTASLDHPHILRVVDWGDDGGFAYLVTELIGGGTLRQRLGGAAIALPDVWDALEPLCAAIQYAHEKGVVHRDLKPENLMITSEGTLKVTDFGLARSLDQQQRLTATGTALGTPAYMAPEQIHGEAVSPAMDQYAIGVIVFEMLTGKLPFQAADPVQQIFQTVTEPAPPPSRFRQLSSGIDEVVLRMLAKEPGQRFPSVAEAAAALQEALLA